MIWFNTATKFSPCTKLVYAYLLKKVIHLSGIKYLILKSLKNEPKLFSMFRMNWETFEECHEIGCTM